MTYDYRICYSLPLKLLALQLLDANLPTERCLSFMRLTTGTQERIERLSSDVRVLISLLAHEMGYLSCGLGLLDFVIATVERSPVVLPFTMTCMSTPLIVQDEYCI